MSAAFMAAPWPIRGRRFLFWSLTGCCRALGDDRTAESTVAEEGYDIGPLTTGCSLTDTASPTHVNFPALQEVSK